MGQIHPFEKEKLICGILFTDESLLSPVLERLESLYGKTDTVSDPYPFSEISPYYDSEMQGSVKRLIVSFATCIDPAKLAAIKETTNAIEADFATAEGRRINLDPGLIGCGKLILATTKPAAHRIPLARGIYAEMTLFYARHAFQNLPWTYIDFRKDEVKAILEEIRKIYMRQRKNGET